MDELAERFANIRLGLSTPAKSKHGWTKMFSCSGSTISSVPTFVPIAHLMHDPFFYLTRIDAI